MYLGRSFERLKKMTIFIFTLCTFCLLVLGCSDRSNEKKAGRLQSAQVPPPSDTIFADKLVATCKQGREQGGKASTAKAGQSEMGSAIRACDEYLNRFPTGQYKHQVDAYIGEAKSWNSYYQKIAEIEDLIGRLQLTPAKRLLNELKDSLPDSEFERISKNIASAESDAIEAKMPGVSVYARDLQIKYASRLIFKTAFAKHVVEGFDLDCKSSDGRFLPLLNVLFAKLASLDGENGHLLIEVDSRDEDVRITDFFIDKRGNVVYSSLGYEINKWGELRAINTRIEAIRNACFMGYGEIWIIPKGKN